MSTTEQIEAALAGVATGPISIDNTGGGCLVAFVPLTDGWQAGFTPDDTEEWPEYVSMREMLTTVDPTTHKWTVCLYDPAAERDDLCDVSVPFAELAASVKALRAAADVEVGDTVTLHVWGGNGYDVVAGTVEAIERNDDFPYNYSERVLILAEDGANAYALRQVVEVRKASR